MIGPFHTPRTLTPLVVSVISDPLLLLLLSVDILLFVIGVFPEAEPAIPASGRP